MIEVTETLHWALIVFAVSIGADGRETVNHSPPSYHASLAACTEEGARLQSVIDVVEGVQVHTACVPRDVVRP